MKLRTWGNGSEGAPSDPAIKACSRCAKAFDQNFKMAHNNPMYLWHFTIPRANCTVIELKVLLNEIAKKWVFQIEEGKQDGYLHYQGCMSLKVKERRNTLVAKFATHECRVGDLSVSHDKTFSYAMKDETRVEGPFKNTDPPLIPKFTAPDENPREWQLRVKDMPQDDRHIHFIVDIVGGSGKTTFALNRRMYHNAIYIPEWHEAKEVGQAIFAQTQDWKNYEIYIDMPRRPLSENKLEQLWNLLEQVKNGYITEVRYHHRIRQILLTKLVVFSNYHLPIADNLSVDRVKVYRIQNGVLHEEQFL